VALERSLNAVVQRHDALRTTYSFTDEKPVRVVAPELSIRLSVIHLIRVAEPDREIRRIAFEDKRRPFVLSKGPLLRVSLLQLSDQEHILLLTQHHIIKDAWSTQILFRELFHLYQADIAGQPSSLSDLPIKYSDFAIWQRWMEQEDTPRHLSYWKTQLQEVVVAEIPADHERPKDRSFHGTRQQIHLSKSLSDALKTLSKQKRATLFMTLLTAFQILLHRYTGQTDIVVGSTLTGRNRPELENLIGFFINLLPLRSDLSGQPSFRDLLAQVRETCLGAYEHGDIRFETLIEELRPKRSLQRNPLFRCCST
jgi:hypothetical protein